MTVSSTRRPLAAGIQEVPRPGALAALAALGVLSALWALFLWAQLVLMHSSGTPLCAVGDAAGCAAVWDSTFAVAIHRFTGLPIAGWGLVWGLAAFAFPFLSLLRIAQNKPVPSLIWAGRWMAISGVVMVSFMIAISALARSFCFDCVITYLLVFWYAIVNLITWQQMSLREAIRGLARAAGANGLIFLVFLYPGLKTLPDPIIEAGKKTLTDDPWSRNRSLGTGTGDPQRDRQLFELVASLDPQLKQTLSDSLYIYLNSSERTLPPARGVRESSKKAPVRITEFTDVLCTHCASLHATLKALRGRVPPGSFSIESRQYPLDMRCNQFVRVRNGRSIRCLAAAAQICLERYEKAFDFSTRLFENQADLTDEKVYEYAAPYLPRPNLERCIESPETQAKLADDVALAYRYHTNRVPLVLVNGRRGTSFEPFLHSMVLTRGAASHPAFEALPEPLPRSDLR